MPLVLEGLMRMPLLRNIQGAMNPRLKVINVPGIRSFASFQESPAMISLNDAKGSKIFYRLSQISNLRILRTPLTRQLKVNQVGWQLLVLH